MVYNFSPMLKNLADKSFEIQYISFTDNLNNKDQIEDIIRHYTKVDRHLGFYLHMLPTS